MDNDAGIVYGVNGHDTWDYGVYGDYAQMEQAFQLLSENGITSYRVDVNPSVPNDIPVLTQLVELGEEYGITIRPMIYVGGDTDDIYELVSQFAEDIPIWELGNELNLEGYANLNQNIADMKAARAAVMQAAEDTGTTLETSINVTATYGGLGLSTDLTTYPYLDAAISQGLEFDYITFHYYPQSYDVSSGWAAYYLDALEKYDKDVFLNETNAASIYAGDDGNSALASATMDEFFTYIETNYSDLVKEINMYELLDNPVPGIVTGSEAHFGIMYDIDSPKGTFNILAEHALAS